MIKAISFDLDGTLLDTLADLAESMNTVLEARQLPTHEIDAYRHFVGNGIGKLVERALPQKERVLPTIEAALAEMAAVYGERFHLKTKPYPGIEAMLDALVEAGIQLTILSNKPHPMTLAAVETMLSRWSFTAVAGAKEDLPKKPDPQGLLAAIENSGIAKEHWLHVGDTDTDMQTAKNAGVTAVGVLWGFRDGKELKANGADHLLTAPADLLKILTLRK